MLTFDTATLEKRERADAMVSAMADTSFSTQLTHENPDGDLPADEPVLSADLLEFITS